MLSVLYDITIKREKCVVMITLNLADKKVVAPLPPENNNLKFFFMLEEKLMCCFFLGGGWQLMPSQFSMST